MKSLLSCIALLAGFCLAADSPYGVCAHLQRWEYDRASEELKLMKAGGIDHVRFDLDWDALETKQGRENHGWNTGNPFLEMLEEENRGKS